MDSDSELESKLISLISQLKSFNDPKDFELELISVISQIISLFSLMDLDSQPKPESEFMSLVTQTVTLFNSMELDLQPKPLSKLISLISRKISCEDSTDSKQKPESDSEFLQLAGQTLALKPEPELISLIYQILFHVQSIDSKLEKLISLCPRVQVILGKGKFCVHEEADQRINNKWECLPLTWDKFSLTGEDVTHFLCLGCIGENHKEYEKAPLEIKHPLHPKHSLELALWEWRSGTRECYCCDDLLSTALYCCLACDCAMSLACVKKPPLLAIDNPKWHEHTLALFPRHTSLTCNICALSDPNSPIYMCPPCDFVIHKRCISLPRVIKISRHLHRIKFTSSFDEADWSCGVCRRKIDNDYGGYSCIKDGCSYVAHSRCATQKNVWDGKELEGESEEIEEEEVEPFVRMSDGIIQHFSHEHHHLRLEENTDRDYDDNKLCQACITPIYFGNFYSCKHCDFSLHEACANLSRKIHHPIHPHMLTLVVGYDGLTRDEYRCSACPRLGTGSFFYECSKGECRFKLHVQCATISEPLVHGSHIHPLFLTSKPGEQRGCRVCDRSYMNYEETFNCIECECDFALCFGCATIPQKVRYKHDKHPLTLSYGKETSTKMYWCEACERKIKPKKRFYMCDEYCCVTLHVKCLIGKDLYMKSGSSWLCRGRKVVLLNNQQMSRPICSNCDKRCPYKTVFQCSGLLFCSCVCINTCLFPMKDY